MRNTFAFYGMFLGEEKKGLLYSGVWNFVLIFENVYIYI